MLYGVDSLKAWIRKALCTDRAAAPVHLITDFGLDGANEILDGSAFDDSAERPGMLTPPSGVAVRGRTPPLPRASPTRASNASANSASSMARDWRRGRLNIATR